jgi:hypothetical protein
MSRVKSRRRRVAVASSRLKGFLSFQELFQNALRNGWKVIRSGWSAGSNRVSATNPTQYPLLSTTMSKPNVTIDITSPGIGTGAALWVTDSGNWYGVVTSQELSVGTGNCGTYAAVDNCGARNACIATGGAFSGNVPWSNPSYCSGGWYTNNCTVGSNASNCSGGWYANTCTVGSNANNCVAGTNAGYYDYCKIYGPSSYHCGTTTEGRQRYDNCKTGGNCVGTGGNCRTFGNCLVYGSYYISCCKAYNAYNSCGYTNPCVGGYIYWTVEVPNSCCRGGWVDGTPNPCISGSPSSPNNCVTGSPGYYDECRYGSPSSPNNCVTGSPGYYDECRYGQPAASGNFYFSGDSYNPCGAGSNCIQTGGNCTNYLDTYPRQIKVFRYASNVLTQVASQTLDSITNYPIIRSLRVVITNATKGGSTATITTKTYSDALFTNQIGADFIHQATGLKINTNYGIIANPSTYNEDISAQSVSIY